MSNITSIAPYVTKEYQDMSLERFEAMFAPAPFVFPALPTSAHETVMASLDDETSQLVKDAEVYNANDHFDIRYQCVYLNANSLYTEEQAIKQIAGLERDELELEKRLSRIRALRRYYTNAAAMLRSSRKTPVYFLNRKTNLYSDKKITYTIMKGHYNHDLRKFAVTEWEVQKFSGKEHREAFKAFEKLVAETPDARGFSISNGYYDRCDYNEPD